MIKLRLWSLILLVSPAWAQPPPSPELDALAKILRGSWTCQNVMTIGKVEQQYPSKVTWTRDLGGFWLTGRTEADAGGLKLEATAHFGYDSRTKSWIEIGFDSKGGWVSLSGKGPPDRIELTGKGTGMGQEMELKVALVSSVSSNGQSFSEATVCRR